MTTPAPVYQSPLGQAIALLRQGHRISPYLSAILREEGHDIPSLHTAHLHQKA